MVLSCSKMKEQQHSSRASPPAPSWLFPATARPLVCERVKRGSKSLNNKPAGRAGDKAGLQPAASSLSSSSTLRGQISIVIAILSCRL